jgi:hypothetical protein
MISTFLFVTLAWIFFRAENISKAIGYIKKIVSNTIQNPSQFLGLPGGHSDPMALQSVIYYVIPMVAFDWVFRRNERELFTTVKMNVLRWLLYVIIGLFVLFFFGTKSSFIYFQF